MNYKSQKGAISLYALLAVMFFMFFMLGAYKIISSKNSSQISSLQYVQKQYYVNDQLLDRWYKEKSTAVLLATSIGSGRINFTNSVSAANGWKMTNADKNIHLYGVIKVTDSSLSTAPVLDFNDVTIPSSVTKSGNVWTIGVSFYITSEMVTKRGQWSYDTTYRFIDVNDIKSSSVISVDYLYKGEQV